MIIGRIWSLNKPRKWDKVNSLVLVSLRFSKENSSIQVGYQSTCSNRGQRCRWNGTLTQQCGLLSWGGNSNKNNP